ncbi:hypothetical protein SPRG_00842 [Saprolegnia parasitica CBS 223.65]|uniref:RING-type domain-containing protein n=1 Tax=Saprolegnia parasitica (strain CBS 223.65) TaxID=695850 RepID=A0A067D807_SAPPC|nr:hypothetical protein SPRG_00842 [Saprolegnia parasitica CBS 223.65]KDO34781.1 hypothetical protein SPRG_00842 [Saprolegnia parasitica CBS 223.65]|eukprot:XP_012194448.1 hypothetical protein SPRG_00842 [Saprolegnia parasitica CBS 223.65]
MLWLTAAVSVLCHLPRTDASGKWTQLFPTTLAEPRARDAMAFQVVGDEAIVFGGAGNGNNLAFDDTWKFDLVRNEWSQCRPQTRPTARYSHVAATNDRSVYVFGGMVVDPSTRSGFRSANDLWRLDVGTCEWAPIATIDSAPAARSEAAAVSLPSAMVIFGGLTIAGGSAVDRNDVWSLDFKTLQWTLMAVDRNKPLPSPRFSHSMTTTTVGGVLTLVVFSGRHLSGATWSLLNDVWLLPLTTNAERAWMMVPTVQPPMSRIFTDAVTIQGAVWLYGGFSLLSDRSQDAIAYDDTLAGMLGALPKTLSFGSDSSSQMMVNEPSARYDHRSAVWRDQLLVYGGRFQFCFSDLWLRNTSSPPTYWAGTADASSTEYILIFVQGGIILVSAIIFLVIAAKLIYLKCYRHPPVGRVAPLGPTPRRGLTKDQMAAFQRAKFTTTDATEELCPICLVDFEDGETLVVLNCTHPFHGECIASWLAQNQTCPMCKRDVLASCSTPGVVAPMLDNSNTLDDNTLIATDL